MPRKYSRQRRRSSKKKITKRSKSKKIRGGVTTRNGVRRGNYRFLSTLKAQDLTRLNRDVFGEIRAFHPLLTPKLNNINLRQAIIGYLSDDFYRKRYVLYRYGEIEDWDVSDVINQPLNNWNVSNVTDMMLMFTRARSFNRPLNNWNVSKVETMFAMFDDATSLNQPLHAPWYHEESEDESDTDSDSE